MATEVVFTGFASRFDASPGDRKDVSDDDARALVNDGIARYATKKDAKEAGGSPDEAATARK